MALPCSPIPRINSICMAERSDLSSRVGRGLFSFVVGMRTPSPLLIMSLALALDFLMSTAPRVPSGPGLALATVSMRSSMLPSWVLLAGDDLRGFVGFGTPGGWFRRCSAIPLLAPTFAAVRKGCEILWQECFSPSEHSFHGFLRFSRRSFVLPVVDAFVLAVGDGDDGA